MYITYVTFNLSGIDENAYSEAVKSLASSYAQVPGLISKIWIKQSNSGTYGGMYFWSSKKDYENYLKSELYKTVSNHPNLVNFNTVCYEDMPEGTSITAGVCHF
ncbi:YdhR family protein [Aliarcobacter butzleri]|uniref:YdhR family protein n=1 Tax=Aliarcobacter butzleri TaxID=28197 RepID=A0AAW7Q205_9BACT|nr:YdhR family protein [Aliarcobacter butzleri]MCG3675268.1 YdhR family protein [Aliarcobacter butzleri]MCG3714223.1 YdhR family protein [Aliarcobacter butzleri]MCT7584658.1 YdhR family protein [Aliarcobacter butzleri]MCT7586256.1 YdhR family protein [Aliarcobacter butzleri]MDN5111106.1 YdhR family protein [Aliarcobacter butzleri]